MSNPDKGYTRVPRPSSYHNRQKITRLTNKQRMLVVTIAVIGVFAFKAYNEPSALISKTMEPTAVPGDKPKALDKASEEVASQDLIPPLDPRYQERPFPNTGEIEWLITYDPNVPLGEVMILDLTKNKKNKVIRIRDGFNQPVAQGYIRPGEGLRIMLPHGAYSGTIGFGDTWYGPDIHFGASGQYFDMENIVSMKGIFTKQILPPDPTKQGMRTIGGSDF